jgi:hypothetical protein
VTRKKRERLFQSGKRDSNPRPQPWQGCALPTELFPRPSSSLLESEVSARCYQLMADGSWLIALNGERRRSDGGEGNRTPDLLNAIQALSQLSYAPGRQEPKIVPRGSPKVKKTGLAKPPWASILQQLFRSRNRAKTHAPCDLRPTRVSVKKSGLLFARRLRHTRPLADRSRNLKT